MTLRIQRLEPGEGARLRKVRLASLADAPDAFGSTYDETAARPEESWREQIASLPTFVAVVDGHDAGVVRGGPDEMPGEAWLLSMWVAPAARGRGAGDALVAAVVAWARAQGFARLHLDVGDYNAPAIALYARHGFEPTGEVGTLPPPRQHVREHRRALVLAPSPSRAEPRSAPRPEGAPEDYVEG